VLLRLPYLALTRVFTLIRLLPTSDTNKDIEILMLRHQLGVLQRQIDKPRLAPLDRAFLAALLHRLHRLHLRQRIPLPPALHAAAIVLPTRGRPCRPARLAEDTVRWS